MIFNRLAVSDNKWILVFHMEKTSEVGIPLLLKFFGGWKRGSGRSKEITARTYPVLKSDSIIYNFLGLNW